MDTGQEQSMADIWEFRGTLEKESDRGCALIAAAYLDVVLSRLLRAALVDNKGVAADLFGHNGALGTFSSRIDLAYMMGYIGEKVRRDLNLIRKIRNNFAHLERPIEFADEKIANWCRDLHHTTAARHLPRSRFINVVMSILGIIERRRTAMNHASPSVDLTDEELNNIRDLNEFIATEYQGISISREDLPDIIKAYHSKKSDQK